MRALLWQPIIFGLPGGRESVEAMVRRHPSHRRVRWDADGRRGLAEGEDVVPLLCAIAADDVQIVRTLLECGADPVRGAGGGHCGMSQHALFPCPIPSHAQHYRGIGVALSDLGAALEWARRRVIGDAADPVPEAASILSVEEEDHLDRAHFGGKPWWKRTTTDDNKRAQLPHSFLYRLRRRDVRRLWSAMVHAWWPQTEASWRECPAARVVVCGNAVEVAAQVGSAEVQAAVAEWAMRWERGEVRRAARWFPGCGWTEEEEVREGVWLQSLPTLMRNREHWWPSDTDDQLPLMAFM